MAVSRNNRHRQQISFWERVFRQLSRYDLLLAAIPLLLVLPLVGHAFLSVSLHTAVAAGSVVSLALVADALYFNPPVDSPAEQSAGTPVDTPDAPAETSVDAD